MSQDKTKPIFGLEKIPDDELLKLARIEIGKLKAYIDELLDENSKLKNQLNSFLSLTPVEKDRAKSAYYTNNVLEKERKWRIEDLELKNKKLKRDNDLLLIRCVELQRRIDEYEGRL